MPLLSQIRKYTAMNNNNKQGNVLCNLSDRVKLDIATIVLLGYPLRSCRRYMLCFYESGRPPRISCSVTAVTET